MARAGSGQDRRGFADTGRRAGRGIPAVPADGADPRGRVGAGDRPGNPAAAEQAAEIGLAQAVLGWRRSDSTGFEMFAHLAIAAQLDRLSTAATSLTGDRSFPVVG